MLSLNHASAHSHKYRSRLRPVHALYTVKMGVFPDSIISIVPIIFYVAVPSRYKTKNPHVLSQRTWGVVRFFELPFPMELSSRLITNKQSRAAGPGSTAPRTNQADSCIKPPLVSYQINGGVRKKAKSIVT